MDIGSCFDRPSVNEEDDSIKKHDNQLFNPYELGSNKLKNRIIIAAKTGCRTDTKTSVPNEMHVKYYSDRATSAGMVLTESTGVSFRGNDFQGACGIWNNDQVE